MARLLRVLTPSIWLLACVPAKSTVPEQDTGASESTDELGEDPLDLPDASESSETSDAPECDYPAYMQCTEPVAAAWAQCRTHCDEPMLSCADELCELQCDFVRTQDSLPCAELYCPGDEQPLDCWDQCQLDALACVEGDCQLHECSWDYYSCVREQCNGLTSLILDYAWDGSCELVLPGPVFLGNFSWGHLDVAGQEYAIGIAGYDTCDDAWADAIAGPEGVYDRITLCDATCEAFAAAEQIRVELIPPPD